MISDTMCVIRRVFKETLIGRTGQTWKLCLGAGLFLAGGISVCAAAFMPIVQTYRGLFEVLLAGGFVLSGAGGAILTATVRCPACGCRFIWWEMRRYSFEQWSSEAFQATECPACGFPHSNRR